MRQRLQPVAAREAAAWVLASLFFGLWLLRPSCPYVWAGGAPGGSPEGSCWVGPDSYAMCTPSLAIDLVIESGEDAVVLVRRGDNGKFATMGGFVDVGEAPRDAVARELKEETNLDLASPPSLLGVFGDPRRDARRHTVSAVYVARTTGAPRPGTDARAVVVVPVADLAGLDFAFDHRAIIHDYLDWRRQILTGKAARHVASGQERAPRRPDVEPFLGGPPVARESCLA